MGNSSSQKAAESAKNRRYSRTSGFAHWMDNIKDKKTLKIALKQTGEGEGSFMLFYTDDSSDDFQVVKSSFTLSGTYRQARADENRDLFGVSIAVNPKGHVILDNELPKVDKKPSKDRASKTGGTDPTKDGIPDPLKMDQTDSTIRTTRFLTEKLVCKLTEGNATQNWTIVPSTQPDCIETTPADIERCVSWEWTGVNGAKVNHQAPPGALDFIGEETFEANGTSSIDLKIRIPHLACGHTPPVMCLNELGGWKLGKKSFV